MLSQFNAIKEELDRIGDAFIADHFKDAVPAVFYEIRINFTKHKDGYHIAECPIKKIYLLRKLPYFNVRPSVDNIEQARSLLTEALDVGRIYIQTEIDGSSWAQPLSCFDNQDDIQGRKCSFSREKLEPEMARLIETYVPKPGQFKCKYCGKATDEAKKYTGAIIARQYPGMRATFDYCSEKCNSYDQMAHEG